YIYKGHREGKKTIIKEPIDSFIQTVTGKTILHLGRRGKYLYFLLSDDFKTTHIISHLGMSGAYFIVNDLDDIKEDNFQKYRQVILSLDNGQKLIYSDIRRFGEMHTYDSLDRKSTRLNSSHVSISYAVFCLKKKKKNEIYDY